MSIALKDCMISWTYRGNKVSTEQREEMMISYNRVVLSMCFCFAMLIDLELVFDDCPFV